MTTSQITLNARAKYVVNVVASVGAHLMVLALLLRGPAKTPVYPPEAGPVEVTLIDPPPPPPGRSPGEGGGGSISVTSIGSASGG